MSKHTPGPWEVEISDDEWNVYAIKPSIMYEDTEQANAKLIEQSPLLLESLQELLSAIKYLADDAGDRVDVAIKNAELAIAKATGEGCQLNG